ncbi:Acireductone dioxygenase [Roseivivax jejudonensis]|uniref:Acireductone dioxygenase n=1 Tax=Roseivivax jejudonensis TaxID=1529041 RepID=A0A1X6ZRP5_9RHOB|nr:cupin domain-containing protein [Roseivivax jejudonensis]SLN59317.1 Acireductone dioxygenase [Roseivivax jejudonensis]
MTQPIHIPHETPEVKVLRETTRGGLKYRLLVDADYGPSSEITQGLFYLYGGHVEDLHRHDIPETLHVVEGSGKITLEDREIEVTPGDTVFVPAGCRHGFDADDDMTLLFTFPVPRFAEIDFDYGDAG